MTDPELKALLEKAQKCVDAMTPAERAAMYAAQRESFVRAELVFGSDADEAKWREENGF